MPQTLPTRALLTGATGFIGGHLARRLHAMGCQTHSIVRNTSHADALAAALGPANVHTHDGTMNNMLQIIRQAQPHIIFHVASLFLSQHRTDDITPLMRTNIEFGTQLAEAAAACKVPHVINTGTSWQHYQNADYNPVNLYAATKQAMADIFRYYAEAGVFAVTHLELFDTYGPGDARPKLFPLLRKAAASGEPLAMSAGEQLIDLVYVDDVIDAYLAAAISPQNPASPLHTYSVSYGTPLPLRHVVERWQSVTGKRLNLHWGARAYRPREVFEPWNRGHLPPGWRPRITLEEGIRRMESAAQTG